MPIIAATSGTNNGTMRMAIANTAPTIVMPMEISNNFTVVSDVSACSKILFTSPNCWTKRSNMPGESSSGWARTLSFNEISLAAGLIFPVNRPSRSSMRFRGLLRISKARPSTINVTPVNVIAAIIIIDVKR